MTDVPIQDQIPDNHCWGCGADNPQGLQLKSFWDGHQAVARFLPDAAFAAGPLHVLNGGHHRHVARLPRRLHRHGAGLRRRAPRHRERAGDLARHDVDDGGVPAPDPARRRGDAHRMGRNGRRHGHRGRLRPVVRRQGAGSGLRPLGPRARVVAARVALRTGRRHGRPKGPAGGSRPPAPVDAKLAG